jgi:hypothetical protein
MATVNLYFGAGGTAGGAATSFATRTSSLTQLKAVMLAGVTSADDVILWGEGLICRETHSSWAAVGGNVMGITSAECVGRSLRIASYSTVDGAQTPLTLTDFYLVGTSTGSWTDTGTTTTKGTKIWVSTSALTGMTNGVGRVWGANYKTDAAFNTKELWEGGNSYSATLGAAIHQNLDIVPGADRAGSCWTCYNSSGVISTSLYIACAVNPYTAFGQITLLTRGSAAVFNFNGLPSVSVDPEVTAMGGGSYGVYLNGCGGAAFPSVVEAAVLCSHPYGKPIYIAGATVNLYISPYVDPLYDSVMPYYPSGGTAHDTGGNQIGISAGSSFSAATGWPEAGLIPGIVFKGKASNGRASRIVDLIHGGIAEDPPSVAGTHKFFRIEDGIEFDFSNVRYGRAFAFVGATDMDVGAIKVTAQRTYSQYTGVAVARFRLRGAKFKSADNVGNLISKGTPWGAGADKRGTSGSLAVYSNSGGYVTGELLIEDCEFDCQDGGITFSVFGSTAWQGKGRVMNSVFRRAAKLTNNNSPVSSADGFLGAINTTSPAALPDNLEFINCVAIGFGAAPFWYASSSPSSSVAQAIDSITVGVNTGWIHFDTYEEFMQAKSDGQLPHIIA